MKNVLLLSTIIFPLFCLSGCHAQTTIENNSLKLVATVPLPGVSGRIDHCAFDYKHKLIFVAALGNNSVEVVDLENRKVIYSIKNLHEPQGVVFIPESNSIFVANGGTGECDVFKAESNYPLVSTIKLSGDADNVRYDSINKKIYVGYGDGRIAIIDAVNFKLLTQIKLSAHPESFQIDEKEKKIYVNVPGEKQVEVIDLEKNVVVDTWKMTTATSNFPMGIDPINHRLFIGCRHSPKLLVVNTQNGEIITNLDIDSDTDDVFYDASSLQIYVSCGNGNVDVFNQVNANTYTNNGKISTRSGARTSLFIPQLNQLIVASPAGSNRDASLLIYNKK